MEIHVETRPGPWGDPEPNVFYIGSRRIGVVDVIDRWLATEHGYFKITADDGDVYILRHDSRTQLWELTLFQREQH